MAWKPINGQLVLAKLDGQIRQLLVTAWNPYTGAVRVAWPPQSPAVVSRHRFSHVGKTEIDEARYEPLDPDAFRADTRGQL
jgi:hypothetical protein